MGRTVAADNEQIGPFHGLVEAYGFVPNLFVLQKELPRAIEGEQRLIEAIAVREYGLSRRLKKTVLFVTHDLDEAVALGDRCLVFSARPGTIIKDVQIPLSRDRNILGLRRDPHYQRVCAELWDFIAPSIEQQAI